MFFNLFSCVDDDDIYSHCHTIPSRNRESELYRGLDEYFSYLNRTIDPFIIGDSLSQYDMSIVKTLIKSTYARKKHPKMWRTGMFGKIYMDINTQDKSFRITFTKEEDGEFITHVHLKGYITIPKGKDCCCYCREKLPGKRMGSCPGCNLEQYCSKSCQVLAWLTGHSDYCTDN